jgi:hypothetical protein
MIDKMIKTQYFTLLKIEYEVKSQKKPNSQSKK